MFPVHFFVIFFVPKYPDAPMCRYAGVFCFGPIIHFTNLENVLSKILAKIDISISKRLTWPWHPAPFFAGAARPEGEGSIELATAGTSNNQQHVTAVGGNEKKD
jgi:hypothetical protein